METKKKILFFLFGGVGGAERMTLTYGKMLPRSKFDVKFVVCGTEKRIIKFIPDTYATLFIKWHNIHIFPRIRIARILLKEKPDFVFASTMQLNILLLQVAKYLKIKCIVRNDNMLSYTTNNIRKKLALYYPSATRIVAQTEEMGKDIADLIHNEDKVICLHNPIDTETIIPKVRNGTSPYPNNGSTNYVCVANFLPAKAHDILISAFKIVNEHNPNARLYLLGGHTDPENHNYCRVKGYADASGVGKYIYFEGFQTNPYIWMKYADCFVLPSRIEGLPNTLLEAMYLETPVVATLSIPIIDRLIVDGYNGYKVLPNHPEEMAVAMEKAIHLKNFRMTYKGTNINDVISLFQ